MKLLWLGLALLAPVSVHAQDSNAALVPQISVIGRSEVRVAPDQATLQISVQTQAKTAAAAASENATKQQAVLAALRSLGLTTEQLSTVNYSVTPEQRYDPGKDPVIVGYTVTNTIVAEIHKLSQVGPVIDAALGHGANMITSLQFSASNTEGARRTALAKAIENARADAEAAARAARGSLGSLLEISITPSSPPPPRPLAMMRLSADGQAQTPVNPGEESIVVEVSTRWRFLTAQ